MNSRKHLPPKHRLPFDYISTGDFQPSLGMAEEYWPPINRYITDIAVIGFILSILSLDFVILALPACICSFMSLSKSRQSENIRILGIIGLVISVSVIFLSLLKYLLSALIFGIMFILPIILFFRYVINRS